MITTDLKVKAFITLSNHTRAMRSAIQPYTDLEFVKDDVKYPLKWDYNEVVYDSHVDITTKEFSDCVLEVFDGKIKFEESPELIHVNCKGVPLFHIEAISKEIFEAPKFTISVNGINEEVRRFVFMHQDILVIKMVPSSNVKPDVNNQLISFSKQILEF